jgi:hypothetical protein
MIEKGTEQPGRLYHKKQNKFCGGVLVGVGVDVVRLVGLRCWRRAGPRGTGQTSGRAGQSRAKKRSCGDTKGLQAPAHERGRGQRST